MAQTVLLLSIISLSLFYSTSAFVNIPLQDFCVADNRSTEARIDDIPCKNPEQVTADDFFARGLHLPLNTTNPSGSAFLPVNVNRMPGLNTLGLSIARADLAPNGYFPPHIHHRATEIVTVLEGSLEIGFIASYPTYKHFNKILEKGDTFVVPVGLIHYVRNPGKLTTVAIVGFNSQNPGIIPVTNGIFGANPEINSDYLASAFQLDKKVVEELQAKF